MRHAQKGKKSLTAAKRSSFGGRWPAVVETEFSTQTLCGGRQRAAPGALSRGYLGGLLQPLPIDRGRVGPEIFEPVVAARLRVEEMDGNVAVILHDPLGRRVAFDAQARFSFARHGRVDFFGQGVDLPPTGAGGHDKEVV